MKADAFFNSHNKAGAGSSHGVLRNCHAISTPSNETMPVSERYKNNVAAIDCEKRKRREYEYHSRVQITELDIPTAAFFPDLEVEDVDLVGSTTSSMTSLDRRPFKRQAHCLDTDNGIYSDRTDSETDSDNEIIHITSSVPKLKLRRRTMITSIKDAHPHIIPEENKVYNKI